MIPRTAERIEPFVYLKSDVKIIQVALELEPPPSPMLRA